MQDSKKSGMMSDDDSSAPDVSSDESEDINSMLPSDSDSADDDGKRGRKREANDVEDGSSKHFNFPKKYLYLTIPIKFKAQQRDIEVVRPWKETSEYHCPAVGLERH